MATIRQFDSESMRLIKQVVNQVLRERPGETRPQRRYPRGGGGAKIVPFTLTEDIGATTSGSAAADIKDWEWSETIEEDVTVLDNGGIFEGGTDGSNGLALKVGSDYHIIQLACGS